jgi:tRNA nucleotidyltransferase (CCA-adding enzyme)
MLDRVRAVPAGRPLLDRLAGMSGVYLVGGAVRDLLLGGRPPDLDLVVEGDTAPVAARLDGEIVVHDRFGTATAAVGGFSYDLARARSETYPRPGALPEVTPSGLQEDLRRRDFTVNAIALALAGPAAGELTAFPGALEDLEQRTLRILHDRSFVEDPTRLLRLARYCGRLGFEIDRHTEELAQRAIRAGALGTVSGPRLGNELRLLAREPEPLLGLQALRELGLDRALHGRFGADDDQLAGRAFALLPADARRDRLALALASRHVPPNELRQLLDRLGFDARDRDAIVATAHRAPDVAEALTAARAPSEIARAVSGVPVEAVALAGALGPERTAREWLERLRTVGLEIDGTDLIAAGIPEGPAVGRGLRAALAAKLDGRAEDRTAQLAAALEAAHADGQR